MTKDYDKIKKQLIEYYQDLLIAQYHDKPKAREIVKANIEEELCNLLEQKVKDAFDVDTAIGVQLDIIGKWVGIERIFKGQKYDNQAWFSLPKYNQETNSFMHGFSTYATFEEEGGLLTYDFILGTKNKLNDDDFRMLIKLKIIRNNVPHSPKPIDDAMYKLFADTLYTVWNEIAYNSNAFTVVGSPTITSDGVASGFSSGNYITTENKFSIDISKSFEAHLSLKDIKYNPSLGDIGVIRFNADSNIRFDLRYNGKMFYLVSNGTGNASESTGIKYFGYDRDMDVKIIFGLNGSTFYCKIKKSYNENWQDLKTTTINIDDTFTNAFIQFGLGWGNYMTSGTGSIDLSQFKIYVDGKEVFNGGYNQPMEMTFYYNPKRYGIVKLGQEKNCFPIPTGVKANFVEVKR